MMGHSMSDESPPEDISPELLSSPPVADDEGFPWDEELSELVLDLEAATLEPTISAMPPSANDFDNATPREVLERVLSLISAPSSRHYERYGEFAAKDVGEVSPLLMGCLRPEVAALVESHNTSSVTQVASLGGDLQYRGRAIYLHIVTLPNGENWYYIGQAWNLYHRIYNQHRNFRYRRDHVSLHNYVVDRSGKDMFVVLATLTKPVEKSDLVLNVLETWCCLLFRSLPKATLEEWLGTGLEEGIPSLNIALPLDTGDEMASKTAFELLKHSEEELAREYYWDMKKGRLRPKPTVAPLPKAIMRSVQVVQGKQAVDFGSMAVGGMIGFCVAALFFWRRAFGKR
ncbi:hypothetical protein E2P81_ATG00230 [Venturia nashicola]|uniref:Uncharacterized protein n=1 Tax=Venturia nashicola TaxID=86259 RepID=A0A4Z1PET9_9PEZI|nr:hypothetical protein E6O75_ATG00240 [Venturia nashicola]TLD39243.1 hypothetical protein E2P81_ATG00230 [Venturia nashicola]